MTVPSLPYAKVDPADIRATACREQFERIHSSFRRYREAESSFVMAPKAEKEKWGAIVRERARQHELTVRAVQGWMLDALEEAQVPVVHDKEGTE